MPVLIVSENTCPHDGFSRNRSTRPSSSVTTIPNSSGFSTDLSPIVAAAPFSRWNSTIRPRSMSQSASPEMTRKVSSRRSLARRTEPAVPSGLSSTEYSISIELDDSAEVDVAERVARDDEEGVIETVAREAHGAGGAERALLDRVLDLEPERLAVAEVGADRLRQERDRDDDVAEVVLAQQLEDVLHARLADDRHHRLRLVRGQRPQPRPLPTRHDDGPHRSSRRARNA